MSVMIHATSRRWPVFMGIPPRAPVIRIRRGRPGTTRPPTLASTLPPGLALRGFLRLDAGDVVRAGGVDVRDGGDRVAGDGVGAARALERRPDPVGGVARAVKVLREGQVGQGLLELGREGVQPSGFDGNSTAAFSKLRLLFANEIPNFLRSQGRRFAVKNHFLGFPVISIMFWAMNFQ